MTGRAGTSRDRPPRDRGRAWRWLAWCAGALLCVTQYAAQRTLWVDELALTRNILDRPLADLVTRPLAFDQVAPAGFLVLQKGVVATLGDSELALRAVPFAMALAALALVGALGRVLIGGWASAIPVLLLGGSGRMIWLSSQAKQYSTDLAVTAALLLVAVTVPAWRTRGRWRWLALLVGLVAPWLSQPSIFSLSAALLGVVLDDRRPGQSPHRFTRRLVAAWAVSALAAVIVARARVTPETMSFMRAYWAAGFAPIPPMGWGDLKWPLHVVRLLVRDIVNGAWSYTYLGVAALGGWELFRRSRTTALVLVLPMAAAFGAATLRLYPLADRLAFFLSPIVVVLMGAGIAAVARGLAELRGSLRPAALLLVALPAVPLLDHRPPYAIQHLSPLLGTLRQQLRPGDRVYVPYGGWQAWTHYAPRAGIAADVILGRCHDRDLAAYGAETERLQGASRGWILFVPAGRLQDASVILRHADRLGTPRAHWVREDRDAAGRPRTVALYLYDLHPVADGQGGRPTPSLAATAAGCRGAAVDR